MTGEGGDGDVEPDLVLCHVHHPEYLRYFILVQILMKYRLDECVCDLQAMENTTAISIPEKNIP